jgi:glycosyltransferase involved in cell wall biosynthesis
MAVHQPYSREIERCTISVLICTHNPKREFLSECLEALKSQTLSQSAWELLLIDNCSSSAVQDSYDLSWHSQGKHLYAKPLGKTHAMAKGIVEAAGRILVIVDDDSVLAENYLENVICVFDRNKILGVIGGIIYGRFEVPPPVWAKRYLPLLAIRNDGDKSLYSYTPDKLHVPPGAGMAILKVIGEYYLQQIANDPLRTSLDPVGDQLSRAGDVDMALCAYELGFAKGYCPELVLTHIIPNERLQPNYLEKLFEGSAYSDTLLHLARGIITPRKEGSLAIRFWHYLKWRLRVLHLDRRQLKIERGGRRGVEAAHRFYLQHHRSPDASGK